MKKIIIALLIIIALGSVTAVGIMINRDNKEKIKVETPKEVGYKEVKLPKINAYLKDKRIGIIKGYVDEMNISMMRDNLVVTSQSDRNVSFDIADENNNIISAKYELRTVDGDRLVDGGDIENYAKGEKFDIKISSIVGINEEYILVIHLQTDEIEEIRYYTRVIVVESDLISAQIDFANDFSNTTIDGEGNVNIVTYMEPDNELLNNSLGTVTLANNYSVITWGNLSAKKISDTEISLADVYVKPTGISGTYIMKYQVEAVGNNEIKDIYDVEERITVWTFNEQQYVLAYERKTNQVWGIDENTVHKSYIDLGIQENQDVSFNYSENKSYLAYEVNGQVWAVDIAKKEFTKIYEADRENVEVITSRVYDNGNVVFATCGYSTGSAHSGKNGVSVYRYNKKQNKVEELTFIKNSTPKKILAAQVAELCYINDDVIYVKMNDGIYYVNISTKETGVLVVGLGAGNYAINKSKNIIAYNTQGDLKDNSGITIYNFADGSKNEITAENDDRLTVCGYAYNNLIYGVATKEVPDKKKNNVGLSSLVILDEEGNQMKTYDAKKCIITGLDILDTVIKIHREKDGEPIEDDQLIDNSQYDEGVASESYYDDTKKLREAAISMHVEFDGSMETKEGKKPSLSLISDETEMPFTKDETNKYYVYSIGILKGIYQDKSEAESVAKESNGLVTDSSGKKIWTFEENYE
jgi:predicted lipoprotein with Yx(FWY)xxD motif